ncbi:uncharacterized protein HD556DRAFT_1337305 [Suillus plorans]|uniref:AB hydrolase-1 domain-containing protein n=1 Tax=Suillus plorans TaxID=116603 RepID=A0A9P7J3Q6_9AGAM|nr:uncharacterized protein HD556DRAFT_1337305 [Suillus plorans]KAG1801394.1 hypothetical protein HD556DRAFT_1337305 [Suillus plorans]
MSNSNTSMGTDRPLRKSNRDPLVSSRRDVHRPTISSDAKHPSPAPIRVSPDCFDIHSRSQLSPGRTFHAHDLLRKHSRKFDQDKGKEKEKTTQLSYAFPTVDLALEVPDFSSGGDITPRIPRHRTRTGPSSAKSKWKETPVPSLRLSVETSSFAESPPQTPLNSSSIRNYSLSHFPVVVSAPVSGVEAMDALVDGMNGFTMEDFFGKSSSSRSRFGNNARHHPLYQPPLPTPPPGVVLGKGKSRRQDKIVPSDEDEDEPRPSPPTRRTRRARLRPGSAQKGSSSTITVDSGLYEVTSSVLDDSVDDLPVALVQPPERPRTVVPSISEIIRNHAPASAQNRSREPQKHVPSDIHTDGHTNGVENEESEAELLTPDTEAEPLGRSSLDSIADEVRRTYHNQKKSHIVPPLASPRAPPLTAMPSNMSDSSSVRLHRAPSDVYSHSSTASARNSQYSLDLIPISISPTSVPQAIAEYLRSARLTTLLKLTRSPHASLDHPLTVSLADMGDPNGFPLVVFLGLGCVRHIMGLYDEMADCLGLRLIAIDRWGLGRTEIPHSKSARGIMEWAAAVEEVLDQLKINECSIIAHSAGAPYALAFANRVPNRIRGDLCLLAPWIGGSESGGYRWLKYVPNGILKTAQAAEWKIQAWMIGKPPTVAYRGIGYTAPLSPRFQNGKSTSGNGVEPSSQPQSPGRNTIYLSDITKRRMSLGSVLSSDYDDLRDFDGRFGSQSTLGARSITQQNRGKPSRGILGRLKASKAISQPPSPAIESPPISTVGKTLKTLRSMGSLTGKSSFPPNAHKKTDVPSPQLPQPLSLDTGLGLGEIDWDATKVRSSPSPIPNLPPLVKPTKPVEFKLPFDKPPLQLLPRQTGQRSISFSASTTSVSRLSPPSVPSSPPASTLSSPHLSVQTTSTAYQTALANALIAASHAEASKGMHSDLLQILNHDNRPWGFSYSDFPHKVQVWYGDKDEKIAENAVRWMEKAMGEDRCHVKVVKGADHALMYKSSVVVEVLERVREFW